MRGFVSAAMFVLGAMALVSCEAKAPARPDFDAALERHLAAIANRDLDAFKASVTTGKTLYTIFQNGGAATTPAETIALHEEWFKDPNWIWEGRVIHKIEGADMAAVVMQYDYRDTPEQTPRTTWLALVFNLENGEWRLVHDQNTFINPQSHTETE